MQYERRLFLVENSNKPVFIGRQWDYYRQFVVCCETEIDARNTHPSGAEVKAESWHLNWIDYDSRQSSKLNVKCLGIALESTGNGVIMSKMMF